MSLNSHGKQEKGFQMNPLKVKEITKLCVICNICISYSHTAIHICLNLSGEISILFYFLYCCSSKFCIQYIPPWQEAMNELCDSATQQPCRKDFRVKAINYWRHKSITLKQPCTKIPSKRGTRKIQFFIGEYRNNEDVFLLWKVESIFFHDVSTFVFSLSFSNDVRLGYDQE